MKVLFSNQKGFTLVEIIAVMVIIGIVAAVAVPRYMDMQEQARVSAAYSAIAEVKAQASHWYAFKLMRDDKVPTVGSVLASVLAGSAEPSVGPDFLVFAEIDGGTSNIKIEVRQVKGVSLSSNVIGTWVYPQQ